jgi:hypothetical protein
MLRACFPDFLELIEPGLIERMELELVTFPHREDLTGWSEDELRDLGLLAEVMTRRGRWFMLLIQVETGAEDRLAVEERLLGSYLRLSLEGRQPARMVVVQLRGGRPGVHLEWIVDEADGEEVLRVPYLAFGLAECRAEDYLAKPQPLAWALATLMRPTERSLVEHRDFCLRRIATCSC